MKFSAVCVLFLCLSVFGSEIDNEIEFNEIDVDEKVEKELTTKNPKYPQLTHYSKKSKPRLLTESEDSSDSNNSSNESSQSTAEFRKSRRRRSSEIENTTEIITTLTVHKLERDEEVEATKTLSSESEDSSNSNDSSNESSQRTAKVRKTRRRRSADIENTTEFITAANKLEKDEEINTTETVDSNNFVDSDSVATKNNKDNEDTNTTEITTTDITNNKDEDEEENLVVSTTESDTENEKTEEENVVVTSTESDKENIINETQSENPNNANDTLLDTALQRVDRLSDQIRVVLQHYQKVGVVALPGKKLLPDPLPMNDLKNSFGFGTSMTFNNMSVYGLNNFTIEHVNTDVDRLQVYLLLHMKRIVILGNYTLRSFFKTSSGPFNVTLVDVDSEGAAELQPDEDGQLQAADSQMDMTAKSMKTDFKNLKSTFLQTIIDGAGLFLLESMKPEILKKVNTVLRTDFNKKLKSITSKLTNSVSPVDMALAEGRRYCRNKGYDPYHMKHFQINQGLFTVKITDFVLVGMCKFYRVGNLSLSMDSGVIEIAIHAATGQLNGTCGWSIAIGNYEKKNNSTFKVDHLQVRALVNQSLDLRKHPQLDELDVALGRINIKMATETPIDLIIAKVVNTLPKLIRHIIVDAVEEPLKHKAQEILNDINITAIVEERLPVLDEFGF